MSEHIKCPICEKMAFEVGRITTSDAYLIKLRCGCVMKQKKLEVPTKPKTLEELYFTQGLDTSSLPKVEGEWDINSYNLEEKPRLTSADGKSLYPFQENTLDFIYNSGARCLVAHEQGLGKTVCALGALAEKPELLPALIVCKTKLSIQWMKQVMNWLGDDVIPQVFSTAKDVVLPGFKIYIISFDLIPRMPQKFHDYMQANIKTVIIDEVQNIMSTTSKRTNGVREVTRGKEHVIALSGTPIKNHAGEYFSILNILHPEKFPSKEHFYFNYVDTYWNGKTNKVAGLKDPEFFHELTKEFILRYTQEEVLPDLPALTRDFQFYDIDDDLRSKYNEIAEELKAFLEEEGDGAFSFQNYTHILAYLSKMRQITAIAKVEAVAEMVLDILANTEKKVIIFLHHHIAREILERKLNNSIDKLYGPSHRPIVLKEGSSPLATEVAKTNFKLESHKRVMILGTLSSGEGVDGLQDACDTMIMMERQWNPANEEQAEKRLHRIGQANPVKVIYPTAIGTCDEFFTETVEFKRQVCKETLGDEGAVKWDETDIVRGLCNAIVEKRGGKKWQLM